MSTMVLCESLQIAKLLDVVQQQDLVNRSANAKVLSHKDSWDTQDNGKISEERGGGRTGQDSH